MNATEQIAQIKRVTKAYLEAWKVVKHSKLHGHTTHTYRDTYPTHKEIKTRFPYRIKTYAIKSVALARSGNQVNPVMADVIVLVRYRGKVKTLYLRCVQEIAPYVPSEAGDWGVNPISIKEVVKQEEVA